MVEEIMPRIQKTGSIGILYGTEEVLLCIEF